MFKMTGPPPKLPRFNSFMVRYETFKEEGVQLKKALRSSQREAEKLLLEKTAGLEKFKQLKMKNDDLRAHIIMMKSRMNQLVEKIERHVKEVKVTEKEIFDTRKQVIIEEHILKNEGIVYENRMPILKPSKCS